MIDHLSKEIKELYPGMPKENESRVYKLLGVRIIKDREGNSRLQCPRSRMLPSSYTIFDHIDQKNKKIQLIQDIVPTGPNAPQPLYNIPGRVEFKADYGGEIRITRDSYPKMMDIDKFLFFSPWLIQNAGQPWHRHHHFGYLYQFVDKKSRAIESVKNEKLVRFAKDRLLDMSEEEHDLLLGQLKLADPRYISPDEKLNELLQYFSDPKKAASFQVLTEDNELKLRALLKKAQKQGHIKMAEDGTRIVWGKGGQTLCTKYPGKTLLDSTLVYMSTPEGSEAVKILYDLVVATDEGHDGSYELPEEILLKEKEQQLSKIEQQLKEKEAELAKLQKSAKSNGNDADADKKEKSTQKDVDKKQKEATAGKGE